MISQKNSGSLSICSNSKHFQSGIGLPAAIFIIVLLVVITAGINQLLDQNAQTYEEEINLTRAFFAAESGAGFAMNGIYPPEEYPAYAGTTCTGTSVSPITYNLAVDGVNNCTANVYCTLVPTAGSNFLTIESEGTCGAVSRKIQVRTSY